MVEDAWSKKAPGGFGFGEAPGQKGVWWFWGLGGGPTRGPWSKRAPGWFWGLGGALVKKGPWVVLGFGEAPGQKGPLVVLGFEGRSYKRHLVKKGPWWFRGLGVVLQGAPGQKGPWWFWRLGRAPCSKRAPGGFGAYTAPPDQSGPLVVLGFGGRSSKGPLVKRAPGGFGG